MTGGGYPLSSDENTKKQTFRASRQNLKHQNQNKQLQNYRHLKSAFSRLIPLFLWLGTGLGVTEHLLSLHVYTKPLNYYMY